jgi:hypothetical protein
MIDIFYGYKLMVPKVPWRPLPLPAGRIGGATASTSQRTGQQRHMTQATVCIQQASTIRDSQQQEPLRCAVRTCKAAT